MYIVRMVFQLPDINRSEFIRSVRFLATSGGVPVHLADNTRPLRPEEIRHLEAQGNVSTDWSAIRVAHEFVTERVHGSHFIGSCVLGAFHDQDGLPAGIYHSTLREAAIGNECRVYRCPLVEHTVVDRGVTLVGSRVAGRHDGAAPSFGNGLVLEVGIETGGRGIPVFADIDHKLAHRILEPAPGDSDGNLDSYRRFVADYRRYADLPWSYIGPECRVDEATITASWIGPSARVGERAIISGSTILSGPNEVTRISGAAAVRDAIVQWGTVVESGALITRSVMMEHTHGERHGKVSESIVGPNSSIGEGEVTASFVGPFTAAHHQSLVIAAFWPQGRGNVGYGANVGSNHTSRAPDQEIWPGEGMFFGLDCAVKFPANFRDAPYSVLATGIVTAPQRMAFPFSLVSDLPRELLADSDRPVPQGLNLLVPAWLLRRNLYAIMRNEAKFRERNKAIRSTFDFDVLRPEIRRLMVAARDRLVAVAAGAPDRVYLPGDIEGIGANVIREEDRRSAVDAYDRAIRLGEYRSRHASGEDLSPDSREEFGRLLLWLRHGVVESRHRDHVRGPEIIPDYARTHTETSDDHFVRQVDDDIRAMLTSLDLPELAAELD